MRELIIILDAIISLILRIIENIFYLTGIIAIAIGISIVVMGEQETLAVLNDVSDRVTEFVKEQSIKINQATSDENGEGGVFGEDKQQAEEKIKSWSVLRTLLTGAGYVFLLWLLVVMGYAFGKIIFVDIPRAYREAHEELKAKGGEGWLMRVPKALTKVMSNIYGGEEDKKQQEDSSLFTRLPAQLSTIQEEEEEGEEEKKKVIKELTREEKATRKKIEGLLENWEEERNKLLESVGNKRHIAQPSDKFAKGIFLRFNNVFEKGPRLFGNFRELEKRPKVKNLENIKLLHEEKNAILKKAPESVKRLLKFYEHGIIFKNRTGDEQVQADHEVQSSLVKFFTPFLKNKGKLTKEMMRENILEHIETMKNFKGTDEYVKFLEKRYDVPKQVNQE